MLNLNLPKVDIDQSEKGTWVDYDEKVSFLIARDGNKPYQNALKKMYKFHKRAIENSTMSNEKADDLLCEIVSKHILLDWKGINSEGKPFLYTPENSYELLSTPDYFEIREWIALESKNMENYRSVETKK